MTKYNHLECPSCQWTPNKEKLWLCSCKQTMDSFASRGQCTACSKQWEITFCPICDTSHKHEDWYTDTDSEFLAIQRILKIDVQPDLLRRWNDKYNDEENNLLFDYLNFRNFRFLTPKDVLGVSHQLPEDKDNIHVSNIFYSLKEKERIKDETYKWFKSSIPTDMVLIARDYRNRLHKYHYPFFDVDTIIPIAFNRDNKSYLIFGFGGPNFKGIYLIDERLSYPIFLSMDKDAFWKNITFTTPGSEKKPKESFTLNDPKFDIPGPMSMGHYNYPAFNFEQLGMDLMKFYQYELKRVFGIESVSEFKNNEILLEIVIDESKYSLRPPIPNAHTYKYRIDEMHHFLNQMLWKKLHQDMKFAFYRLGDTLVCHRVDLIMEGLRSGAIEANKNMHLPIQSFSSVQYPALNFEYLKTMPIGDDWNENSKIVFLSDLSRY